MNLVRILALSLLLGTAVAGMVWFTWGVIANLAGGRKVAPAAAGAPKDAKKEPAGGEAKRA